MPRRHLVFAALALVAAIVCARLGFWQLSRLRERQAANALVEGRLRLPVVTSLRELPTDTADARFRRVRLRGRFDYDHEVRLTGRSRNGSPGVNIVTPLRLADTNVAVLVNRGWVYSPNGADADFARWREEDSATVVGFVTTLGARRGSERSATADARSLRWLDEREIGRAAGYPVAPFTVVRQDSAMAAARRDSTPARLAVPPLDEGSHRGYAVQWFFFALIALVGPALLFTSLRREQPR